VARSPRQRQSPGHVTVRLLETQRPGTAICPRVASHRDPPHLSLPSGWDYRGECRRPAAILFLNFADSLTFVTTVLCDPPHLCLLPEASGPPKKEAPSAVPLGMATGDRSGGPSCSVPRGPRWWWPESPVGLWFPGQMFESSTALGLRARGQRAGWAGAEVPQCPLWGHKSQRGGGGGRDCLQSGLTAPNGRR
jgi:hypothetical protein